MNSLVASTNALAALSQAQRQVLEEAATATRDWVTQTGTSPAGDAAAFCRAGGTVVAAAEADVAAFKAAAAPVYAKLEADPETKARIAKIRELAAVLPAPESAGTCSAGG